MSTPVFNRSQRKELVMPSNREPRFAAPLIPLEAASLEDLAGRLRSHLEGRRVQLLIEWPNPDGLGIVEDFTVTAVKVGERPRAKNDNGRHLLIAGSSNAALVFAPGDQITSSGWETQVGFHRTSGDYVTLTILSGGI